MITLKDRVENLLNQKYVGNLLFFKNAVSKFSSSLLNIKTSYKSVYTALVTVQNQEEPQKSSARNLTNSMDALKQFSMPKRVIGKKAGSCSNTRIRAVIEWSGKIIGQDYRRSSKRWL